MKRRFILIAIMVMTVVCAFGLSACGVDDDYTNLGREFVPFDEAEFVQTMATGGENRVLVSENGVAQFKYIVYPDELDLVEFDGDTYDRLYRHEVELINATKFMANTLNQMIYGGAGEIVAISQKSYDDSHVGEKAIFVEKTSVDGVEDDGYKFVVTDSRIAIVANKFRGLTNGVYDVLESEFGCMFVSQTYDYIPHLPTIYLSECEKTINPDVEWRNVYTYEALYRETEGLDKDYIGWHNKIKLNGAGNDDWYRWCHSSFKFISPEEYFDTHPEYFSMYMGKRVYEQGPVSGQLCWTNEDVYRIIYDKVTKEMEENPDIHIWDVSQMDTWINRGKGCTCPDCKAIDDAEDSQMGSLLTFVNRLARDIKERFPDNYISTLAYNYTAKPPKNIMPEDNVIIKLCLMPGDVTAPYSSPRSKEGEDAKKIVEDWGTRAKHILIWDYNINFHNYMMPYPILDSLKETNDFYIQNNAYGMFHQMSFDKGGDMAEINSYIFARLMWNKDTDVQEVYNKYMTVYYGKSAKYMAEYYDRLATNVEKTGEDLYIYSSVQSHMAGYLSEKNINSYLECFDNAIETANGDQILIDRINRAKISVLFVKGEQFAADCKGREAAIEEMVELCNKNGIDSLMEGEGNGNELQNFYDRNMAQVKAMPAIIIAMILGCLLVLFLILAIGYMIARKVKYGTVRRKKKEEQAS